MTRAKTRKSSGSDATADEPVVYQKQLERDQNMTFVNVTPHAIVVRLADGSEQVFPPSGVIARCSSKNIPCSSIEGVPCSKTSFGEVEGLPPPQEGVVYIASLLVRERSARSDVVSPDTGPTAIRENGQVKAVLGFCCN